MRNFALQVENLTFRYKGQTNPCLSNINLEIAEGERFGLFGPNGAGKSTLIHLMTGLFSFRDGNIFLYGNEMNQKKKSVNKLFGLVPQDFSFYHELSPVENLDFFGAWAGLKKSEIKKRTEELLAILGLEEVRNKQMKKFSGGMKRRVNLAIGVIHQPKILFLDEPTVGVDVQTRHAIINYLKELNKNGTTLIYTSHQLGEAEALCEKVALIDEGKIIAYDELKKLFVHHSEEELEGLFLKLTGKIFRD